MTGRKRVDQQPAWLLHHRPFRDSSSILDVFSRDHGRVALVSRGSRSAKSKLRGILRPFLPLNLTWVIRTDLGTLTGAEMQGSPISLTGDALLSGYYVNELMLHMLHKHDPQSDIFAIYTKTIESLAGISEVAPVLRKFEIELLRMLGYALDLDHDTHAGEKVRPEARYEYRAEQGPVAVSERGGPMIFSGEELLAIQEQRFSDSNVLRNANRLLRNVIAYHLDGKELKSRKVMREMKRATEG